MFGVDHPLGRGQVPAAVRTLGYRRHAAMGEILRAVHLGRFGESIGRAGRVQITILIVPQRGVVVFRINKWVPFGQFLGRDELLVQSHIPRLRPFAFQVVIPFFGRGRIEAARDVQPNGMARGLLDFLIQINRVALQT